MFGIQVNNETDKVDYGSLFKKDYLAFPNRKNRDVHGQQEYFRIKTNRPHEEWSGNLEKSIERIVYTRINKDSAVPLPENVISKIEFEGWRRYVPERQANDGGRLILHVRNIQHQSHLARILDDKSFREIGWMEPIVVVPEDPFLAVNFRETAVENNPDYIDDLFARISRIEELPNEVMCDLKNVIALNSIERFKKKMIECGFSEYEYEEALKLIRPTALKDVASPHYVAAVFCKDNRKFREARKLLKKIPKAHWQYEEARNLERSLYEQEIRELRNEVHQLKMKDTEGPIEKRSTINQDIANTEKIQKQLASEFKQTSPLETQSIQPNHLISKANNSIDNFGTEIIPYFNAMLSSAERQKNLQSIKPKSQRRTRQGA